MDDRQIEKYLRDKYLRLRKQQASGARITASPGDLGWSLGEIDRLREQYAKLHKASARVYLTMTEELGCKEEERRALEDATDKAHSQLATILLKTNENGEDYPQSLAPSSLTSEEEDSAKAQVEQAVMEDGGVLTRDQVRALLEEGKKCRADVEARISRMEKPGCSGCKCSRVK